MHYIEYPDFMYAIVETKKFCGFHKAYPDKSTKHCVCHSTTAKRIKQLSELSSDEIQQLNEINKNKSYLKIK